MQTSTNTHGTRPVPPGWRCRSCGAVEVRGIDEMARLAERRGATLELVTSIRFPGKAVR